MLQFRWFHHFKALVIAASALFLVGVCCGFVWLNNHGFEGEWGERIAAELARQGIHAEFESVRFSPTRGIIAKKVLFYTDQSRTAVWARIPVLRFDVDRGKAFRGELQIRRVFLSDAHLSLPITTDGPALQISNLTGSASLDRENRLLLEGARGTLGGMNFLLDVEFDEFDLVNLSKEREASSTSRRDDFAQDLFTELARWSFPSNTPPELSLRLSGSLRRSSSIRTSFSLQANELTRHDYTMEQVRLEGTLDSRTLTVSELSFSEGSGKLDVRAHYDLQDKHGAYDLTSSLKIADLLRKGLNNHTLSEFTSALAPRIEAQGEWVISKEEGLMLSTVGNLEWDYFRFLGIPLDQLKTEFSWQNGDIYLRNLKVKHESGKLDGEILLQDDLIRYRSTSSLPFSAYRVFIEGSGLERTLAKCAFTKDSKVMVEAEGTIQRSNLRNWDARGKISLEHFSYNEVPMILAASEFYITPLDSIFTDVQAEFNYAGSGGDHRHQGPPSGKMHATGIRYDAETKLTHLDSLQGTAWPAPILRLFVPGAADHVEKHYRFRTPPQLSASGVIDVKKPGLRTDVLTRVVANSATDYDFLGQTLQLNDLSGTVRTRPHLHDISALKFSIFSGTGGGSLTIQENKNRPPSVSGRIECNKINLAELGENYAFANALQGSLTANFEFEAEEETPAQGERGWRVVGTTNLKDSSYNNVPIRSASAEFEISPRGSLWSGIVLEFDYTNYLLRRRHGGPASAVMMADKIRYDKKDQLTSLANLRGEIWPGPALRLVYPGGADHVDESYGFHRPPSLTANGVVDHRKPGLRTDLKTRIVTRGTTNYEFLDRPVQLNNLSAIVRTRNRRYDVTDLNFRSFAGTGAGMITVRTRPGRPPSIDGGIKWNEMRLGEIGRVYGFEKAAYGTLTGRIDFTSVPGHTNALQGKGVVGLRNGQLFHVPIFGPLSPPIGGVLGKKFSHEQARDASATFVLRNGVAYTKDFLTSTPSTTFVGEGKIDLVNKRVDMTMRMNARGLLGLVTLPLLPLNGLFQFRGQGPLKKPVWSSAPFTRPVEGKNHPIFRDPPKAQIVPER